MTTRSWQRGAQAAPQRPLGSQSWATVNTTPAVKQLARPYRLDGARSGRSIDRYAVVLQHRPQVLFYALRSAAEVRGVGRLNGFDGVRVEEHGVVAPISPVDPFEPPTLLHVGTEVALLDQPPSHGRTRAGSSCCHASWSSGWSPSFRHRLPRGRELLVRHVRWTAGFGRIQPAEPQKGPLVKRNTTALPAMCPTRAAARCHSNTSHRNRTHDEVTTTPDSASRLVRGHFQP